MNENTLTEEGLEKRASKVKIAAIILTLNEEERIRDCLLSIRQYVDYILVFDGESNDQTVKVAKEYADQVCSVRFSGSFAVEKNQARKLVPQEYKWILWLDADERFDKGFIKKIKYHIAAAETGEGICFRFPRINLSKPNSWPDYQVRLFRNSRDIEWKGEIHEVPYYVPENVPVDTLDNDKRELKMFVYTANDFPILHLPRRSDLKRIWWNDH